MTERVITFKLLSTSRMQVIGAPMGRIKLGRWFQYQSSGEYVSTERIADMDIHVARDFELDITARPSEVGVVRINYHPTESAYCLTVGGAGFYVEMWFSSRIECSQVRDKILDWISTYEYGI